MVSNNFGPNMDYGIGGAYYGSLQSNINDVTSYISTPYPPDSYTPNYNPAPNYNYPPSGRQYNGSQGYYAAQNPPSIATQKAELTTADDYLNKMRQEAINQGQPGELAAINARQNQVDNAQDLLENLPQQQC